MTHTQIHALIVLLSASLIGCDSKNKVDTFNMSADSPVTYHDSHDPEIEEASRRAKDSFKYFWKEASFDFNRIIPALEIACVKVPFSDDPKDPESKVEHMWLTEVDFDGEVIHGVLMNTPNWLRSVKEGDSVEVRVEDISDWMCVSSGVVYGGYTVQVTRKRMSVNERKEFDAAWGLNFSPPEDVVLPPSPSPFESVLARQLEVELGRNPDLLTHRNDDGRTLLHLDALYGRSLSVEVLLKAGADPTTKCNRGWTAVDYAKATGWEEIIDQLRKNKVY